MVTRNLVQKSALTTLMTVALLLPLSACDKPEDKAPEVEEKSEQDKEVEERLRKKREERAAKEKAEKEAEEARQKQLAEITALPDEEAMKDVPKKVDKACKAAAAAHDEFMLRTGDDDQDATWAQHKQMQLQMTESGCNKTGTRETAACLINAFSKGDAEMRKLVPDILLNCDKVLDAGAEADGETEAGAPG